MTAPPPAEIVLSDEEYARISAVVEAHLGIRLPPEKRTLVARRLRDPIVRSGHRDFKGWAAVHLVEPLDRALLSDLADALTTNHTFFWREPEHFVHFRDQVLPERIRARAAERDLRVWCAATATGEEPYQLAMIVRDALGGSGWEAGVLATDVSAKALAFARAGRYPADRLAALPEPWRRKYVQVGSDGAGTMSATIKSDVTFRRLNLLNEPWRFRREFDVIFCRNVLIYFDPPVKDQVVSGLVRWLAPGGTLYVGHAEALPARRWPITSQGPGIWRKNP